MKVLVTWERLAPDTVGGNKLRVTTTYMSFDKDEIDKLERNIGETTAIIMDNVELKEKESEDNGTQCLTTYQLYLILLGYITEHADKDECHDVENVLLELYKRAKTESEK